MLQKDLSYWVKLTITAMIIFGGHFMSGVGVITPFGTTIVGIFCGLIVGYCTLGMIIPSFMALISLGFSGYALLGDVLKMSFGDGTVLFIISILLLSAMLAHSKLSEKILGKMLSMNSIKGKPWAISFVFWLAAYVIAIFINSIPSTIICWTLLFDLFAKLGYKPGDKWPMTMILGVLFTSVLGAAIAPFQISVVSNFGLLGIVSQGAVGLKPLNYMIWATVCSVVLFALFMVFARFVIRPDVSLVKHADFGDADKAGLTTEQKIITVIFALFAIGLILPSILPEGNMVKEFFAAMGNAGWGLTMVLLAILIRIDGEPVFDFTRMFSEGVIWDIVMMIATVFTIVGAITSDSTGVPQAISMLLSPMFNALSPMVFFIIVIMIYTIIANLTNTVALTCIFIPILYVFLQNTEINMAVFVAISVFVSTASFLVPAATVNAVMMYQNEWVPKKEAVVFAIFSMVIVYLVMVVVGLPLGNVLLA